MKIFYTLFAIAFTALIYANYWVMHDIAGYTTYPSCELLDEQYNKGMINLNTYAEFKQGCIK